MITSQQRQRILCPLTSLQIGDMQSYVSKLYVHVGKKKLIFFVDHGPWSAEKSLRSKPVELWQFMVTQSRISPFANRSSRHCLRERLPRGRDKSIVDDQDNACSSVRWSLKRRLFYNQQNHSVKSFCDLFQTRLSSVVQMQDLSHWLHGCVTFELEWEKIRGINYLNELQTDTCIALELKVLVKRDFCDMEKATAFYGLKHFGSQFPLSSLDDILESRKLQERQSNYLNADENLSSGSQSSDGLLSDGEIPAREHCYLHDTPDSEVEVYDAVCHLHKEVYGSGCDNDIEMTEEYKSLSLNTKEGSCNCEKTVVMGIPDNRHIDRPAIEEQDSAVNSAENDSHHSSEISEILSFSSHSQDGDEMDFSTYRDTLLMFRFCDPVLPFELKEIITADHRLLKMLESGLPSWVVFLQSYPVFKTLYRPWMRPLAKTLYIVVSVVTVIIGFYDLYKNVPVLKAMAARLGGPFFEWIEAWEMVSRVKYLGTVLFLQNWEKAFRWLMLVFSTMRKLSNLIFQPLLEPLVDFAGLVSPFWNLILDTILDLASLLSMIFMSILEYAYIIVQLLVFPFIWLLTTISSLVTWILYPILYTIWGFIKLPLSIVGLMVDFIVAVFCSIYKAFQSLWLLINSSSQLVSVSGPHTGKAAKTSASTLRLLWNDLFSQVFRAVRSILNVLVACLTTCNRHRLSIYNRSQALLSQVRDLVKLTPRKEEACSPQVLEARPFENEGKKRSSRALGSTSSRRSRKKLYLAGTESSHSLS